ncbi:hypothetical protein FD755_011775, partial [Muntiacus reevesi]
ARIPGNKDSGGRLDANLISLVPDRSFEGLTSLRHLWLDDNALTEIPVSALGHLRALQAVTLALNRLGRVPDYAFRNLSRLVVLHLHNNRIRHLGAHSFEGLQNLETLTTNDSSQGSPPLALGRPRPPRLSPLPANPRALVELVCSGVGEMVEGGPVDRWAAGSWRTTWRGACGAELQPPAPPGRRRGTSLLSLQLTGSVNADGRLV